ncbi:MAG: HAMP domain-containing histidine kinase [Clostridiales bacterium]|nr:HAMP domain-containing histidine kinase [Clostridiales bacterium]
MQLRHKLPLAVLLISLLNIAVLLIYISAFLPKDIRESVEQTQLELRDSINNEILPLCNSGDIKESLKQYADENNIRVTVTNSLGQDVLMHDKLPENVFYPISRSFPVQAADGVYSVSVTVAMGTFDIESIISFTPIKNLIITEAIVISVIYLFVIVYIYTRLVKPLLRLKTDMELYEKGVIPSGVNRNDEIGWISQRFAELTARLKAKDEEKKKVIASISHDIKTPLTSVMGYAERLEKKDLPDDVKRKYIQIIYSRAHHIQSLIDDVDMYLSYNREHTMIFTKISAFELCREIESEFSEDPILKNAEFSVDFIGNDCILRIDNAQIKRVFSNIINNSIRHSSSQHTSIQILCNNGVFEVSDNGGGVSEEKLQKLFDPFYTSDSSRHVAGLGLAICKSIVEAHNGVISAKNNERGGLSIIFTLGEDNK